MGGGLLGDSWLGGGLWRGGSQRGGLLEGGLTRVILPGISLLIVGLCRVDLLNNEEGFSSCFGSGRFGYGLGNTFLFSVAGGSLAKVFYRILMVETISFPRINGVVWHLNNVEVGTFRR